MTALTGPEVGDFDQEPAYPGATDDVLSAERAVLATMIASRAVAEEAADLLGGSDAFATGVHQAVYEAVRWLTEEGTMDTPGSLDGTVVDPGVTQRFTAVLSRLVSANRGIWRTGAAGAALADISRNVDPVWRRSAAIVLRAARQRRTVAALEGALHAARRPGFDADESGDDLIRRPVDEALSGAAGNTGTVTAASLFISTLEELESDEPPGLIQFPYADLRDIIPFLQPGQLVSIMARPSVGKSLSGLDLVRYNSLRLGHPSVLFTMEMSRAEVMRRMLAAESGVDHGRIVSHDLDDDAWRRIYGVKDRFDESVLVIDDSSGVTLAHARAKLRGMERRDRGMPARPARLAVFDYLQLMKAPPGAQSREQEVAALSSGLKAMAKDFAIPVVMLCQLNRGPEQRQDKRPVMSDARESGAIENDSDIVILIHREDMYDPESPKAGEAELIVAKNRGGRRGTATVGFHGRYQRLVDLAWSPDRAAERAA